LGFAARGFAARGFAVAALATRFAARFRGRSSG
jgi:hypothetical protein